MYLRTVESWGLRARLRQASRRSWCAGCLADRPGSLPIASGGSLHKLQASAIVVVFAIEQDVWAPPFINVQVQKHPPARKLLLNIYDGCFPSFELYRPFPVQILAL